MRRAGGDRNKDLAEAEAALRRANKVVPHAAEPLYQLGQVYLLRKRNKEARSWFQNALDCDPHHKGASAELKSLKRGLLLRVSQYLKT